MPLRRFLLLLPPILAIAWLAWAWRELPAEIARFDSAGHPRGATSRAAFAAWMVGRQLWIAFGSAALATWIPRAPDRWINLPDKEYWLAPERRVATLERFALLFDLSGIVGGLIVFCMQVATVEMSRQRTGTLPTWCSVVFLAGFAFLVVALLWAVRSLGRRRRATRDPHSSA